MIVYKNLNIKPIHKNSVVAIGNFDGVHLGHQKVLLEAKKLAKKKKSKFGFLEFKSSLGGNLINGEINLDESEFLEVTNKLTKIDADNPPVIIARMETRSHNS